APACPINGAAGCTPLGTEYNIADYTLNANGGNIGYVAIRFFSNTTCTLAGYTNVNLSNNPYMGFNTNAYQIGNTVNCLQ
ncbi:MAG: hypothetical protein AABY45_01990, partial [Deltaproteobacteria bacterium]